MKTFGLWLGFLLLYSAIGSTGWATNYYVAASGSTPDGQWTNWAGAHTNLIEVVARCRDNDTVYVTNNAIYYLTNYATISYAVALRSWAPDGGLDPTNTILNGNYPNTTNRIFYVNNYGAWVKGFTITNGCEPSANGGGVWLRLGHLTNCVITGNRCYRTNDNSTDGGGGLHLGPGSGTSGSVWNCTISGNFCSNDGGGIKVSQGGPWVIANCMIAENVTTNIIISSYGDGGGIGAYNASGGLELRDCWIVSNSSLMSGGGLYVYRGQLTRCVVMGNSSMSGSGGGVYLRDGLVRNCVIYNNSCNPGGNSLGGGLYFDSNNGLAQNCTIYSNVAANGGGLGFYNGNSYVENSVIWANRNTSGTKSNYWIDATATVSFTNCCTAPDVGAYGPNCFATNSIASDPQFADLAVDNCRLQPASPSINAGFNRSWMDGATDYEGLSRIDGFSRVVDMGAYEYLHRGTLVTIK